MSKKEKESQDQTLTLEQVTNNADELWMNLKSGLDHALSSVSPHEKLTRLDHLIAGALPNLRTLRGDIRTLMGYSHPVAALEVELEHPCDDFEVIMNKLDPEEHCHGCINEPALQAYVPKGARIRPYIEATEASTEEDEPDDETRIY
jgi:hypothetical protein